MRKLRQIFEKLRQMAREMAKVAGFQKNVINRHRAMFKSILRDQQTYVVLKKRSKKTAM